jgi:Concanavalin A-like lectin/glucanases superfamily/IPT/TIG domain
MLLAAILAGPAAAQSVSEQGMLSVSPPSGQVGCVSIADSPTLVPTSAMTVEAWAYAASTSFEPTIVRKGPFYPSSSWLIRLNGNGNQVKAYLNVNNDPGLYFTANVPNVGNAWHHYALTYDGSVARLFLDGVEVGSLNVVGSITFAPGALLIGKGESVIYEQWVGAIDEVRLWSVARTAAQIQADRFYEVGPTPGLLDVWRFNGDFQDSIGNNHGVAVGSAQAVLSTSPVTGTWLTAPAILPLGATVPFDIVSSATGVLYVFDLSITGTSPGVVLPPPINLTIPLNQPWLNHDLDYAVPPGTFQGFLGVIPASHHAFPLLQLPGDPALTGITVSSAFVLIDPSLPTLLAFVSEPRTSVVGGFGPNIAGVTPATVPQAGGVLTITGNSFQPGATVHVDGAPATNVTVNGPTSITATAPPGSLGPADVTVTNPDTLSDTLPGGVTYVVTPVVSSIAPVVAPPGATVVISGSGFATGLQLVIAGVAVLNPAVTPTSITFQAPAGTPCNALVTVINPDLQTTSTTWNPPPVIGGAYNNWGSAAGGGLFFVLGQFTPGTTVTVGGSPATVTSSTATALLVTAPPGSLGAQAVVISSATGCTASTVYFYQ